MTSTHNSITSSPRALRRNAQDQDTAWLTIEQEHDPHCLSSTFTQHSQDKTEDEDIIDIHDSFFDDLYEDENNYMMEDEDMTENTSHSHMDEKAVVSSDSTTLPSPCNAVSPALSDTHTNSSFDKGGTFDDNCRRGQKRHWTDRKNCTNHQESDGGGIFTKRYRTYHRINDHPPSRSNNRHHYHTKHWTSTHFEEDHPAPDDNRDSLSGFKEQVEDLRQLINAVTVRSNTSYPRSVSSIPSSSATSDLVSDPTTSARNSGRRHPAPEAISLSATRKFTDLCFAHHPTDDGESASTEPKPPMVRSLRQQYLTKTFDSGGSKRDNNTAFSTPSKAPLPGSCSKNDNNIHTTNNNTFSPETLLQLALSELNCLITRHDEEKAAHQKTKNGLTFVESRLMDAYKRIRVLSEDYEHVLQRCKRAERSLLLAHNNRDGHDHNHDERSSQSEQKQEWK
ncbi:hypothetical protein BGZ72_006421 [Mortierella alpina]|nr:hypothetical protein BGZ72_006421 [Mortierella alpina]